MVVDNTGWDKLLPLPWSSLPGDVSKEDDEEDGEDEQEIIENRGE